MNILRTLSFAAIASLTFAASPSFAQDAMAPDAMATDAMAPDAMAPDAMAADPMAPMMSDADLALCLEQAGAITFPSVMEAAQAACHGEHNAMAPDAMAPDAMATDAMAPDAMATDAMAPAQ